MIVRININSSFQERVDWKLFKKAPIRLNKENTVKNCKTLGKNKRQNVRGRQSVNTRYPCQGLLFD